MTPICHRSFMTPICLRSFMTPTFDLLMIVMMVSPASCSQPSTAGHWFTNLKFTIYCLNMRSVPTKKKCTKTIVNYFLGTCVCTYLNIRMWRCQTNFLWPQLWCQIFLIRHQNTYMLLYSFRFKQASTLNQRTKNIFQIH